MNLDLLPREKTTLHTQVQSNPYFAIKGREIAWKCHKDHNSFHKALLDRTRPNMAVIFIYKHFLFLLKDFLFDLEKFCLLLFNVNYKLENMTKIVLFHLSIGIICQMLWYGYYTKPLWLVIILWSFMAEYRLVNKKRVDLQAINCGDI